MARIFEVSNIFLYKLVSSNENQSFLGPMVRIPPFQGGGRCSVSTFESPLRRNGRTNVSPKKIHRGCKNQ